MPKQPKRFYCSSIGNKLSYYHRSEGESFKYITVGELLQNAAENYGDRISLITYSEKKRISFAETLDKVIMIDQQDFNKIAKSFFLLTRLIV